MSATPNLNETIDVSNLQTKGQYVSSTHTQLYVALHVDVIEMDHLGHVDTETMI